MAVGFMGLDFSLVLFSTGRKVEQTVFLVVGASELVGDSVVWCCSLVGAQSLERGVDDEEPYPVAEGSQDAY